MSVTISFVCLLVGSSAAGDEAGLAYPPPKMTCHGRPGRTWAAGTAARDAAAAVAAAAAVPAAAAGTAAAIGCRAFAAGS